MEIEDMFQLNLRELRDYLKEKGVGLIDTYGLDSSGSLRDSFFVGETDDESGFTNGLAVRFNHYGVFLNEGINGSDPAFNRGSPFTAVSGNALVGDGTQVAQAGAGRVPIIFSDIRQWVVRENIHTAFGQDVDSTTFLIARSLRRRGYEPRPWLDDLFEDDIEIEIAILDALDQTVDTVVQDTVNELRNEGLATIT